MFSQEMENLIQAALQDGVLTDQEKNALVRRAQKEGIDIDELDIYIQSLLQKRHQEMAEKEAENDRQSKMGTVKKCPNCGQPIQSGWAACPACGYAFNIKGELNASVVQLQKDLQQISESYRRDINRLATEGPSIKGLITSSLSMDFSPADKLKMQCAAEKFATIMNVVVGNSRAELLDFLAFSMPKANKDGSKNGYVTGMVYGQQGKVFKNEDFGLAYWTLFSNCISAASVSFRNDPAFAQYFAFFEKETAKKKKSFFAKLFGR